MSGSSTDLVYRIVPTLDGDGFKKTSEEAWKAVEDLDELLKKTEELDHAKVEVTVKADTGEAETKLKALDRAASDSGQSAGSSAPGFAVLHSKFIALGGAAGALAPALAALPAAFAGLAAVGGTAALGLGGISKALQDYGTASSAAGQSSASLAQTAFTNSQAVKSAQQGITDAERQAGISAQNSADSVANAKTGLADAYRAFGIAAQNSADSVAAAEQRLAQAQLSAKVAEENLTAARKAEASTLIQLNDAAATAALDVRSAEFALTDARKAQAQTNQTLTATTEDRQKAELAVEQAQLNLARTQQRVTDSTAAAADANAKGVEGSASVVAAKRAEAAAGQQTVDAQHALVVAQRNAADQQIASNEAVAKSQQSLATAERSASQQQVASNEAVAKALQNLADVQTSQALAAAVAAQQAGGAANQFAKDMAKLTPDGRALVEQLISMKGGFEQLKATAQTSMAPGLTTMLKDTGPLLPIFNQAIGGTGKVIGDIGVQFGQLFQNPVFQGQFAQVLHDGIGLMQQLGSAIAPMFGGLIGAASQASPIVAGLGQGFHDIMASGIPAFLQGLTVNAKGAGQGFGAILGTISDLLGPLGTLLGTIGGALGPVFAALRPVIGQVVQALVTGLVPIIQQLSPILVKLAPLFGQLAITLIQALAPIIKALLPIIAQLIGSFATALVPIIQALAPIVLLLVNAFASMMPALMPLVQMVANVLVAALQALMPVITPLIPIIVHLVEVFLRVLVEALQPMIPVILMLVDTFVKLLPQLMPLIDDLVRIFEAVLPLMPIFMQLVTTVEMFVIPILGTLIGWWARLEQMMIGPVVDAIVGIAHTFGHVMEDIKKPLTDGLKWISDHFDGLVTMVTGLPGKFASGASHLWDWLGSGLKLAVNAVVVGMNWVIDQINGLTGGLSDTWSWAGIPAIGNIGHVAPMLGAGGLITEGGMAIVGDRGPELMPMKTGARVISNPDARAMFGMGGGQQAAPGEFHAVIDLMLDGQKIDQQLVKFLRQGGTLQSTAAR